MIRVLIADDDELMRAGLRGILQSDPGITVAGEAADGERAVLRARDLEPDVVLMDVRMPGTDGIAATERICAGETPPRVLVLTTFAHDDYVLGALRAGASGFLLKRAAPEDLIAAVHGVVAGETPIAREVLALVVDQARRRAPGSGEPAELTDLTAREREVLTLVARGHTNAEIADALVVEASTVKSHVKAVLAKLGLRNRVQVVVWAYENGVVVPGSG